MEVFKPVFLLLVLRTVKGIGDCDFEADWCGWTQDTDDHFDWSRRAGPTGTTGTGPQGDHTTGTGFYIYTEASGNRKNHVTRLRSPVLPATNEARCMTLWYHMYGIHVKQFRVLKTDSNGDSVIFQRDGSQGNMWHRAQITVSSNEEYTVALEASIGGGIKSDIAVDDISFSSGRCDEPQQCGSTTPTRSLRVMGGQQSEDGQWPWLCHVRIYVAGNSFKRCAATIIHPKWLTTAAHCFEYKGKRVTSPNKITVHCGEMDIFRWGDTDFIVRPKAIHTHPNRTQQGKAPNDIALIELSYNLQFDRHVNAACLPDKQQAWETNTPCVVAGWGYTKHDQDDSDVLLHVSLFYITHEDCSTIFGSMPGFVLPDNVCAGDSEALVSACKGDSGGGLYCRQNDTDPYYHLGIVSWGVPCGKYGMGIPSAYASVLHHLDWIEAAIGQ